MGSQRHTADKRLSFQNLERGINPTTGGHLNRKIPIRYEGEGEDPVDQNFGNLRHLHEGHDDDPIPIDVLFPDVEEDNFFIDR